MSTRKIIDAKQNGEKVWLKGHAQATFMSDGKTVEDAINSIGDVDLKDYAKLEDIPSLDGYAKLEDIPDISEIPSLDGYATEQWVEDKNYLTEHLSISHLASKEELNSGLANIDFDAINNTPFTNDESGELNIIDEQGNVGLKVSEDGIYVKEVIVGEHILSNKQNTLISGTTIKTINGESILGEGNLTVTTEANIQAVDTTDEIEDVETNTYVKYVALTLTDELKALVRENIGALSASDLVTVDLSNYYTKEEINSLLGDINTILESIINGGFVNSIFPITLTIGNNGLTAVDLINYVVQNHENGMYSFKENEIVTYNSSIIPYFYYNGGYLISYPINNGYLVIDQSGLVMLDYGAEN